MRGGNACGRWNHLVPGSQDYLSDQGAPNEEEDLNKRNLAAPVVLIELNDRVGRWLIEHSDARLIQRDGDDELSDAFTNDETNAGALTS
jgi:hypothetical protein